MRLSFVRALAAGVSVVAFGCEPALPNYASGVDECSGTCADHAGGGTTGASTSGAGGGATTTGAGGGGGGTAGGDEVQGTVSLITSPCITSSANPFNGVANVVVNAGAASSQTSPYGGMNPMTFDFTGVPGSGVWMYVQDVSMGGADILSTLSYFALPQPMITVPVVELGMFTQLAMQTSLVQTGGLNTAASQVVLQIMSTATGMPYVGLQVTGGSGGAIVAYDAGACAYSDSNTSTGALGTAILFNSGLAGSVQINLTDTATMLIHTTPAIYVTPGAVTIATVTF